MELYWKDTQDQEGGWEVSSTVALFISGFYCSNSESYSCLQNSTVNLFEPRRMSKLFHYYLLYSKYLQGDVFSLLFLNIDIINKTLTISKTDMCNYYHSFLILSLKVTSVLLLRILVHVCSMILWSVLLLDFWTLLTAWSNVLNKEPGF